MNMAYLTQLLGVAVAVVVDDQELATVLMAVVVAQNPVAERPSKLALDQHLVGRARGYQAAGDEKDEITVASLVEMMGGDDDRGATG
ncbi:MAG: hypothetical protein GY925_20570, partial [Actinomycetia bacterium]|nr:hypothetical protein [Actinomycetes bacterium]